MEVTREKAIGMIAKCVLRENRRYKRQQADIKSTSIRRVLRIMGMLDIYAHYNIRDCPYRMAPVIFEDRYQASRTESSKQNRSFRGVLVF